MNKSILSIVLTSFMVLGSTTTQVQASAATELGKDVAKSILSAVAGDAASKVMGLIFGNGENNITIAQVNNAINQAFAKAALQDVNSEHVNLVNSINAYEPEDDEVDIATRIRRVDDVIKNTDALQGRIDASITKENSVVVIPLFISCWSSRLAFMAENYHISQTESRKRVLGRAALSGLEYLERYLTNYFHDTKRNHPCVAKAPTTPLRLNGAVGSNWTEKGIDVSEWYCIGNGRVLKGNPSAKDRERLSLTKRAPDSLVVNLSGAWYMKNTDMGYESGYYMFARRMDPLGSKVFLEQSPSKTFAYMLRNHYFLKYYPHELGDIHGLILQWVDVVEKCGTDEEMHRALVMAMDLGIGWNTLRDRYKNEQFNKGYIDGQIGLFKFHGETRVIHDEKNQ